MDIEVDTLIQLPSSQAGVTRGKPEYPMKRFPRTVEIRGGNLMEVLCDIHMYTKVCIQICAVYFAASSRLILGVVCIQDAWTY